MAPQPDQSQKKINLNSYIRYSGLAFQLMGLVFIFFYLGKWVDGRLGNDKPYIGMVSILVVFTAYMYKLYKELFK